MLTSAHFEHAIDDVAAHGDNDMLPFDIDTKFIGDCKGDLATMLLEFGRRLEKKTPKDVKSTLKAIPILSEKLLAPAGYSGFRISTKIHPFWNLYLNGLGVAVAELHEPTRSARAHSYRFAPSEGSLFDGNATWRAFRLASLETCARDYPNGVVVQTDISSFYDHVYHHRLKNYLNDDLPETSTIPAQIEQILPALTGGGRSFGLPIGGQGARIFAEVLLSSIDRFLAAEGVSWHRYVDDLVLFADDQRDAYRVLGVLARALATLGLSLNRTKTAVLSAVNYRDYVQAQLGGNDKEAKLLMEIDLKFDPYSDTAASDYESLKEAVQQLDLERLLRRELEKGQADTFVVAQIGRSLISTTPERALDLAETLLDFRNLHSFRASWSTVMRGIARVRANDAYSEIFEYLDRGLDRVPQHSAHLVSVDTNCLHYLRTIRAARTEARQEFVLSVFKEAGATVRRACIDCWISWRDRERFLALRGDWQSLSQAEQRMLWLGASKFGDDGKYFRDQERRTLNNLWALGIERKKVPSYSETYREWAETYAPIGT